MGIFSGNLSAMRYFVEGEPVLDNRSAVIERIQQFAIPELSVESEEEQSMGWASVENILDTDFSPEKVFYNEYIFVEGTTFVIVI